jgi:hypothetical protein
MEKFRSALGAEAEFASDCTSRELGSERIMSGRNRLMWSQLPCPSSDQSRLPRIEDVGLLRDRDYLWRCALVQVKRAGQLKRSQQPHQRRFYRRESPPHSG